MNLVFDIGNVICEWNPDALVKRLFETPAQQQEALRSVIHHPDWVELDRGTLDIETALTNAASRSFLDREALRSLYLETPASLVPDASVVATLRDLKARGYPLFTLSNMQQHSWHWLFPKYDFWSLFDGIVVSYEVHMVKPEREIFEYISGRFSLDPAESLFLDDMQVNVDAAGNFGMHTILVTSVKQALNDLYLKLGIKRDT